jgi:hypothetical protein
VSCDGDELSGGNEAPREPVVWRQELQWHISTHIGICRSDRRVPGSNMAPQRHVRCANDVEVMAKSQIRPGATLMAMSSWIEVLTYLQGFTIHLS